MPTASPENYEFRPVLLAWFLRSLGLLDLLALLVVFLPMEWIAWCHQLTRLGQLPDGQIVGYLARSTSALYALHGAVLIFLSFDVARYRPLIRFVGWLTLAHGSMLLFIDVRSGMPVWWIWSEGPAFSAIGLALVLSSQWDRRQRRQEF